MMIRRTIYIKGLVKIIGKLKNWFKRLLKNKDRNSLSPGELPLLYGRKMVWA